ncbi:SDR family NAD(P)-dependent oxidoreductase [Cupriavidus sp. CV2]|uniref:SDR family NAD(P)-dependent oxidoreductase n=1 Tax=Cupriavidus ulmosensis TaxID=3065913 RepID=UPI00296AE7BE|nr:SDR family NAD(P)-dependent oxidoreductase [Cupriavidus sp. CV2]MDW3686594.1 SDR family NAD(P)-dependent oxidoreductase [Cupriavidus sp. CV2]
MVETRPLAVVTAYSQLPGSGPSLTGGAAAGTGALYADRLAKRGYDLLLVSRDASRLALLSDRLRRETGVEITAISADLSAPEDVARVESILGKVGDISLLVNAAAAAAPGGFAAAAQETLDRLIQVNISTLVRLTAAALPGVLSARGAIVNLTSETAFAPQLPTGLYSASKAFVLTFSQSLAEQLAKPAVFVQTVVLPTTQREIWELSGRMQGEPDHHAFDVGALVDSALEGFDRQERVTFPGRDIGQRWQEFMQASQALAAGMTGAIER